MLINLSNHPLNTWSDLQVEIAKQNYGNIVDIHFPQIDPFADPESVNALADKYFDECMMLLNQSGDKNNAVHLMGEHTFCFSLINKLLSKGVEVIASTAKRNSKNIGGCKTSKFEFINFRSYK